MTTIRSEIIADSINEQGNRLTTFQLRYPRWIHAEARTHRQLAIGEDEFEFLLESKTPSLMADPNLSRNASSSRAVPVSKLIDDVLTDPAIPMFWGANQRGMQAGEECDNDVIFPMGEIKGYRNWDKLDRESAWLVARNRAIEAAKAFDEAGYHKQIVNRLLEPFSHINVVVTATEWSNFFALRLHKDAEPHINLLAQRMKDSMWASTPNELKPGEWHLPYVNDQECRHLGFDTSLKLSVARCASVSYKTVDGLDMTADRAISLYDKLVGAHPIHASPAEHQGTPDYFKDGKWFAPHHHGNFVGFVQHRKTLPFECL